MFYDWAPYVPVAERRRKAAGAMARLAKKGQTISPVVVHGRTIATTAWGKAWCGNMESYSDYANRLPRGRTYVRNGSVLDLQIAPRKVTALVSGTDIYRVAVRISAVPSSTLVRRLVIFRRSTLCASRGSRASATAMHSYSQS